MDTNSITNAFIAPAAKSGIWEALAKNPRRTISNDTRLPIAPEPTLNTDMQEAMTIDGYLDTYPQASEEVAADAVDALNDSIIKENANTLRKAVAHGSNAYANTMASIYEDIAREAYAQRGDFGIAADPTFVFAEIGMVAVTDESGKEYASFEEMLQAGINLYDKLHSSLGGTPEATEKLYAILLEVAKKQLSDY